jgi:hypothetical protein
LPNLYAYESIAIDKIALNSEKICGFFCEIASCSPWKREPNQEGKNSWVKLAWGKQFLKPNDAGQTMNH